MTNLTKDAEKIIQTIPSNEMFVVNDLELEMVFIILKL